MLKQALRSYMASLHPRNFRKIKNNSGMFIWFYWLIISPIWNNIEQPEDAVEQIWFYVANITPYFIMWWSNLEQKLSMPKQMYLLPMKYEERKKYVRNTLIIKIGFPVGITVLLQFIRGFIYEVEIFRIILCVFAVCSFGIGMYVCSSLHSKFDRYIRYAVRGKDGTGKDAWLNWICMIYSAVCHFVACGVEVEVGAGESPIRVAISCMIPWAIMLVMVVAIVKTRYEKTIKDVCNYEESFRVLGKVRNV